MNLTEINPHFEEFIFHWESKFYFLLGGYGSGKSHAAALKLVLKLLQEERTALVVRNVFETHRDSCFSLIREILAQMELEGFAKVSVSPMKISFYNGSAILFKGMDRPEKLKSINGVSILWAEECTEVPYAGFKELLGRLRHPSLPLHFILSCNPVDKQNWTFKHFFKGSGQENEHEVLNDETLYEKRQVIAGDTFYHHSVAEDNRFLPKSYVEQLEELKAYDLDMYRVARLGRFGANGVKVLPNFQVCAHGQVMEKVAECPILRAGMDFGFETSYNALVRLAVDPAAQTLYVYWEYYKNRMTDDQTAAEIDEFRQSGELIYADSAEPKTIRYFQRQGFSMVGAKKFPHSRLANVKKLRRFHRIVCSDACPMTVEELSNLVFAKDKNGEIMNTVFNIDAHTLSAIWYGLDGYEAAELKPRKAFFGKGMR